MLDRFLKIGLLCVGVVLVLAGIGLYAHFYPATVKPTVRPPVKPTKSSMPSGPKRLAGLDVARSLSGDVDGSRLRGRRPEREQS